MRSRNEQRERKTAERSVLCEQSCEVSGHVTELSPRKDLKCCLSSDATSGFYRSLVSVVAGGEPSLHRLPLLP